MTKKILIKTLMESPVIKKGDYQYVVHPITDGIPEISNELLTEVVNEMFKRIKKYGKIDKIVTMEAMGIPLATALSLKMKIPFVIIRKRSYGLPGEIDVEQTTGYSKTKLFINGLKTNDNIIIVDDVLSTGGTLSAVVSALKKLGVIIKGVFIAINKGKAVKDLMEKYNISIEIIINIDVINGKVVFINNNI
ncbi:MAG: hypoxanthine/guanine phosphoribosyltransferase [Candidatus Thermoplasmatota archaeon]|jgi:adenine phosphoribosyltransferase|nr:hypoxanthine/guanine phosphoribosyltransferase [Candidatus Thermoplasmatota archaeon]